MKKILEKKILITTPDTEMSGGVAAFYKNLNLNTYSNIDYFFVQHRSDDVYKLKKIYLYPIKFIKFFWKCTNVSTVVINPSFERNSLLRDAVYFFIAKKLLKRRTIIFWHGWVEGFEEDVKKSFIYKYLLSNYYSTANQTIILNNLFKEKLINLGYSSIHNFLLSSVAADDSFVHSFQIDKKFNVIKKVKLLFLSRVIAEKGIFKAINIMNKLVNHKEVKNIELLIAGDGEDSVKAKSLVESLQLQDHVKFLGFVKDYDKYRLLYESHILILPTSYIEGMPVSILEAMLFGLFILASNKGGMVDIISEKNGTLIDENNSDGYVDKIIELMENRSELRNIGMYNHQYSIKHYTASVVKEKLHMIFTRKSALIS